MDDAAVVATHLVGGGRRLTDVRRNFDRERGCGRGRTGVLSMSFLLFVCFVCFFWGGGRTGMTSQTPKDTTDDVTDTERHHR